MVKFVVNAGFFGGDRWSWHERFLNLNEVGSFDGRK